MLRAFKELIRKIVPSPILARALSAHHFALAALAALVCGFPSSKLTVIGVTGTKGKSSTIEFLDSIFEAAGHKTALLNSIRIKIDAESEKNTVGRSMPGRFFIQRFLERAVEADCTVAIIEMTSEGARQHRHRFIELDALVFTNLAPEHIESHGSLEAYADAKFELAKQLTRSRKRPRYMIANAADTESPRYLTLPIEHPLPFSLESMPWEADEAGGTLTFEGTRMHIRLPGRFSLLNAVAAATTARAMGIEVRDIATGLDAVRLIPGRAERIEAGQDFVVVVDYAHTPDSLQAILDSYGTRKKICVLGSAGGGRDIWKRPLMGEIAEKNCAHVILTNDDPYDEDPRSIVEAIERGMTRDSHEIILDRREAIRRAIEIALKMATESRPLDAARGDQNGIAVLITGKGIDPMYGRGGKKIPWSDAAVAREEIAALLKKDAVQ